MMDECKTCDIRGDLDKCLKTVCQTHNSWLVGALLQELKEVKDSYSEAATGELDLQFAIMHYLNDGKPTSPRTYNQVLEDAANEIKEFKEVCINAGWCPDCKKKMSSFYSRDADAVGYECSYCKNVYDKEVC